VKSLEVNVPKTLRRKKPSLKNQNPNKNPIKTKE
jgi:hypothetical protein